MRLCALLLACAVASPAATYFLTISGLGGEPDYDQRFKMWALDIDSSLKKAGSGNVVTLIAPNRERIRAQFQELARSAKPDDALVVMLIGHGTDDGVDYKFNIPGPDITGAELAALVDRVPAVRQCVAVMTSSSGGAIAFLRRPNRVVITATKTGTEKNAAVFGQLIMWTDILTRPGDMFVESYPHLQFGKLETLEFDHGIEDANWLEHETDVDKKSAQTELEFL